MNSYSQGGSSCSPEEYFLTVIAACSAKRARSILCWIKWIQSSIAHFNCAEGFVLAQRYVNYMSRCKADIWPSHSASMAPFAATTQRNPGCSGFFSRSLHSVGHLGKKQDHLGLFEF